MSHTMAEEGRVSGSRIISNVFSLTVNAKYIYICILYFFFHRGVFSCDLYKNKFDVLMGAPAKFLLVY